MSYQIILNSIKKNEIANIYLLYGEEIYLMEEAVKRLIKKLVSPDFESLNLMTFDGKDLTAEKLIDACETLPFMAEKKLVLVKNFEGFQGKKKVLTEDDEEELIGYFQKISDSTCLVFYGQPTIDSRRKIVKTISKYGQVINIEKLKENELSQWILKEIKGYDKEIQPKELTYLMNHLDYFGRNATQTLMDIANEIKKIAYYMGDESKVEISHIEKVSTFKFQNDIFKLLDAVGQRNIQETLKRLNHLLEEGEVIIRLMVTLSNQLKNILSTKLLLEEGYNPKMIASKIGIHPFVASKCAEQSRHYSIKQLKALLNHFLEMDLMIKSGKINDRLALELLLMEMCNKKEH
ncbi:DNA polymerase III subunit delta [Alkaliphilus transvaalensis]|uniref:DNA polymerase III subunit delta n=1 Tax=Alkaliphilus transvaalensis TaxID=114628 RepID=UPI00047A9DC5|nr:DNA polymerase III subunit delta [Alkaliphilus transvaalensis]